MNSCVHCARPSPAGDEMCVWCGRWQNGRAPMCDTHGSTLSVGVCSVCLRPLCDACSTSINGRLVCHDAGHRRIAEDHRLLLSLESEFEADWILEHLRQGGVKGQQFSLRAHAGARWYPVQHPVRIYVPSGSVASARELLTRFEDLTLLTAE